MLTSTIKARRRQLTVALRSGKYKQGRSGVLRDTPSGFCCQGVACDLVDPKQWYRGEGLGRRTFLFASGDSIEWPFDVREHFGFDEDDGHELAAMNDGSATIHTHRPAESQFTLGERCTFEEIADAIDFMTLAGL